MQEIKFDLISILVTVGIFHGIFLSIVFFFNKKGNTFSNKMIGLLMFAVSLSINYGMLIKSNLYQYAPHLLRVGIPVQLLFGPLIYLYIKKIIRHSDQKDEKKINLILHFIPFIIVIIFMLPYFLSSGAEKIHYVLNPSQLPKRWLNLVINIIIQIQIWSYLVLVWRKISKLEKELKELYSDTSKINLHWIKDIIIQLIIVFAVIAVILFIRILTPQLNTIFTKSFDNQVIPLLVSIIIYRIGYKALTQPEILIPEIILIEKAVEPVGLDKKILTYMEENKPYLDPDISLPQLAEELNMTRNQLSAQINKGTGKNFFDFINEYRIEEVKKDLLNPEKDQFTILALAMDVGYNSKATFNKAFKSIVGMTPREFKQTRNKV